MESVVPEGLRWHYDDWHISPLVVHERFGFISGVTGTRADGTCASDPAEEFVEAFDKLGVVLGAGGMDYADILEMTTFHIGMREHLDVFRQVRDRYLTEPWSAWSAIGTTELAVAGPRVEIRVIAEAAIWPPDEPLGRVRPIRFLQYSPGGTAVASGSRHRTGTEDDACPRP